MMNHLNNIKKAPNLLTIFRPLENLENQKCLRMKFGGPFLESSKMNGPCIGI